MLVNVQIQTINGILTFMRTMNFTLSLVGHELFYNLFLNFFLCTWSLEKLQSEIKHHPLECLSQDQGVVGLSLTGVTAMCPLSRHINSCLVLAQPSKTLAHKTEKNVDLEVKNQIKQTKTKIIFGNKTN